MKNLFFIFFISISLSGQNYIDPDKLTSKLGKREKKEKYYGNLVKNAYRIIEQGYKGNSKEWIEVLNNVQSIHLNSEKTKTGIKLILSENVDNNLKLQRKSIETAHTLFPESFQDQIKNILQKTSDEISFALSSNYLRKSEPPSYFIQLAEKKFENLENSVLLKSLIYDINGNKFNLPPLNVLLNHDFQKGKTIVYTLFRKNRKYPGITIIKKPDGKFLKNRNGEFFHISQLGLSYSNLPFYIPNGNTPQGIYSIIGTYISPTETIGPTPNLLLRSPFEVSTEIFYHGKVESRKWEIENYKDLLPKDWQNYKPIYNSFKAGKIGRKLIIVHGSTDEPDYFKNEIYYPLVPTQGCLSSKELWDQKTGKLFESDQVKLINAFRSAGNSKGFLVVVEIDDQNKPVTISEIESILD
jgi:hypothetical protein